MNAIKVSVAAVLTGVLITVISGLISTGFERLWPPSMYKILGGHMVYSAGGSSVARVNSLKPDATDLGNHDICMLSSVAMQKVPNGYATCSIAKNGSNWFLQAEVLVNSGDGEQAWCQAACADIR
jgi:hypothetical protein